MMHNEYRSLEQIFGLKNHNANYLVNVSVKNRYIYFEAPKVGCSTIKRTLQKIEDPLFDNENPKAIHNKRESPLLSPNMLEHPLEYYIEEAQFFTFALVRNPFSRILSCYLDKFAKRGPNNLKLFPILNFDPADEVSFPEFLEAVGKQDPNDMNIHWRPQAYLIPNHRIRFDFIGHFERFEEDLNTVLERIFPAFDRVYSLNGHATGADNRLKEYYCDASERLVREIYAKDFEQFAYNPVLPL